MHIKYKLTFADCLVMLIFAGLICALILTRPKPKPIVIQAGPSQGTGNVGKVEVDFSQLNPTNPVAVAIADLAKLVKAMEGPEKWLKHIEIWKCDDGRFELRTANTVFDRYDSYDHAKIAKQKVAEWFEMKWQESKTSTNRLPDCGKRLE